MLRITTVAAIVHFLVGGAMAQENQGEKLFGGVCIACHTINGGKLIGPDLADVHKRRPTEWIIKFVQSSQSVIKSGDPYAVSLFEEYNNMVMPDNDLTNAEVMSIINYIASNSTGGPAGGTAVQAAAEERPATQEDVEAGRKLFVGETRLANGGPSCISCHDVKVDNMMAGGALAKDLTDAHSRLTGPGVRGMISNSPFPAMKKAFDNKPLTDEEVFQLGAFLEYASTEGPSTDAMRYQARLFLSGCSGAIAIVLLLAGVWTRTKKRSVNHSIYERQVRSTWE